jgi:hypothetical protein
MSNITYKCALFTNPRKGQNDPQLTGHITVPVSRIDELITLLQSSRVFMDRDDATVRIPLAFWSADPKSAPLVLSGQSSFMATAATSSTPVVDTAPSF